LHNILKYIIYNSKLPSFCVVQSVRTVKLTYAAQFDLEKPVMVRMLTVLKCACTNGTEVQGEETERVFTPERTGKRFKNYSTSLNEQERRPAIHPLLFLPGIELKTSNSYIAL